MLDLKLAHDGDLELTEEGDILSTNSVCQAVRVRLLWFFKEWRLGPDMGFPYFEEVFIKNPNEAKIRHLVRETVLDVNEVTDVKSIEYSMDKNTRFLVLTVVFCTDEATFSEEAHIQW